MKRVCSVLAPTSANAFKSYSMLENYQRSPGRAGRPVIKGVQKQKTFDHTPSEISSQFQHQLNFDCTQCLLFDYGRSKLCQFSLPP
jgi:hypothetical protein